MILALVAPYFGLIAFANSSKVKYVRLNVAYRVSAIYSKSSKILARISQSNSSPFVSTDTFCRTLNSSQILGIISTLSFEFEFLLKYQYLNCGNERLG